MSSLERTNSENPLYRSIYNKLKPEDNVGSSKEGMERIMREKYAFLVWELYYTLNHQGDCDKFMLSKIYFPDHISFLMRKGSPLTPILNNIILDLTSSGHLTKLWLDLKLTSDECDNFETSSLEFLTLLTSFLVLAGGTVASLVMLGAEWLMSLRIKKRFT
ncbi:uncharacterized protein LOC122260068 [Penaeus japonicus]|uniref:uncharacterized protein LOC122260068 n=1 Tax=Penaeus japonicus TaxID=27405 RepID=UPI001C70C04E|nr:uncharacterized protein LOC122260068 [Penaeus japonicus]